jgi:hypothetical protein
VETFVVRVWVPAEPETELERDVLRGFVEWSGWEKPCAFVGADQLVGVLLAGKHRATGGRTSRAGPASPSAASP